MFLIPKTILVDLQNDENEMQISILVSVDGLSCKMKYVDGETADYNVIERVIRSTPVEYPSKFIKTAADDR